MVWEWAVLEGGPADGIRARVPERARVLQVTADCPVEDNAQGVRVAAIHVYRRSHGEPARYGWDPASP
ncbi:hypothetical protein [Actinacidiphila guanduensis]|uniref:Uncharacterized protein n=1 Tax=Actinacidiphila guanduensis TaxID=310781 RepID=A0A1H0BCT6_9ACTN|nr:hypothetical protein [Actinacidiphila guanduensis]SDN43482.1 hypothetical protein SAMN05216259_104140 [Actinacidiphila guanduensis]